MIVTVTPNPSLDRTLHVRRLVRGEVHRVESTTVEPSGKGVNVSVALVAAGVPTTAVLALGGPTGRQLRDLLGVPCRPVPIGRPVRSNVSIVEADGTTTKINERGPELTRAEVDALITAAADTPGECVAWCGSLPGGFAPARLADAVAAARAAGRTVVLDTSDEALAAVLDQPADRLPHVIKPNADELAALVGGPLPTTDAVIAAARSLVNRGVWTVLVSLGADGGVLVDADTALHRPAPAVPVVNTAGAGDAFLAGYLAAAGQPEPQRLESALRFGAAAVSRPGTLLREAPGGF